MHNERGGGSGGGGDDDNDRRGAYGNFVKFTFFSNEMISLSLSLAAYKQFPVF